jgi:hypothetical protein
LIKVVNQGVGYPSFYDDVVHVGLDEVISYFVLEALLDSTLVCSPCVFVPKRHGCVTICAKRSDERSFDLVDGVQRDLVITRVVVEEREKFASGRRVNHLVDTRETKGILRIVFVKIGVINTHSPFIFFFLTSTGLVSQFR